MDSGTEQEDVSLEEQEQEKQGGLTNQGTKKKIDLLTTCKIRKHLVVFRRRKCLHIMTLT